MIIFAGDYFDGRTSRSLPVQIESDGKRLRLRGSGAVVPGDFLLRECRITPPLGRSRRVIHLPDGAMFETDDNEAVERLERAGGSNAGMRLVQLLENHWRLVLGCFAGLLIFVWAGFVYGIPLAAEKIASSLPPGLMDEVSDHTLALLDNRYLAASELEGGERTRLTRIFHDMVPPKAAFDYRLLFRKGNGMGANAFALPSGAIIVTDELVARAVSDGELMGVLAHEMAHVQRRHGMRSLLQNTGVFLFVSMLVGDLTSITSVAATLPTMLAESGYSRDFEREADRLAGRSLLARGTGTAPYRNLLSRLDRETSGRTLGFLASHPLTGERVALLARLEEDYHRLK